MRDIIFKDLTSLNKKRKEVLISEITEEQGLITRTEKKAVYIVKEKTQIRDPLNLKNWLLSHPDKKPPHAGHLSIHREIDTKESRQKFICRSTGNFRAVTSEFIFSIDFVRQFKMELTQP